MRHSLCLLVAAVLAGLSPICVADVVLMHNLDGDASFVGETPRQSTARLRQVVDDLHAAQVETLMYCIGAGSDVLYYPTEAASTWGWRKTKYEELPAWSARIQRGREAIEAGLDAPRIAGERARELGMGFVPSYRMNDSHYCVDPMNHPLTGRFWIENRDAEIGESPIPGAASLGHLLNFARDDVRAYRLAVIFEAMDRYADLMTGFELDFVRFQVFFPPGQAEVHAHLITEMVEQVRRRLDAIGTVRGRAIKLVVRVPPALHNCRWAGLDVADWIRRRLVDVVIPAQNLTISHDMPIDEFVRLAEPVGVEVVGSILGRTGYSWPFVAEHSPAAYAEEVTRTPDVAHALGAAKNQLHLGASGIQLFNFRFFRTDPDLMAAFVSGLTSEEAFLRSNRRYLVTHSHYRDSDDTYEYRKQLPAPLQPGKPASLRLLVGEDLANAMPRPRYVGLRLGLHGADRDDDGIALSVDLNGHRIHDGATAGVLVVTTGERHGIARHPATEAYLQWPISDLATLRRGWNTVQVTLFPNSKRPSLQLVDAEIGVLAPTSHDTRIAN